ncbi:hypothetical protein [Roseivivax sp. CAU 1753]
MSTLAIAPGVALMAVPRSVTTGLTDAVGQAGLLLAIAILSTIAVHLSSWGRRADHATDAPRPAETAAARTEAPRTEAPRTEAAQSSAALATHGQPSPVPPKPARPTSSRAQSSKAQSSKAQSSRAQSSKAQSSRARPEALLLARAHRRPPDSFPDIDTQRAHITTRLARRYWLDAKPYGPDEPDLLDFAISTVIGHVVDLWQVPASEELSDTQVRELFMLDRLSAAAPAEAGRLAQEFRNPALAIDIRDQISALGKQRIAFERTRDAFEATQALAQSSLELSDMRQALDALGVADPELWHHIVIRHDPLDPRQRDAALWCVTRPECNRATVAQWFFDLVMDGTLESAAKRHDAAFLAAVQAVISAWNADVYCRNEIGLTPDDAVAASAMTIARRLDRVAELAGTTRWDMPCGMFESYPGRVARPRPAWDIASGQIVAAPEASDYLTFG